MFFWLAIIHKLLTALHLISLYWWFIRSFLYWTFIAFSLKIFSRNYITILIIISFLFLPFTFLYHFTCSVVVDIFCLRYSLTSQARLILTLEAIHMDTIVHITLMFLSRLSSWILFLLWALILLLHTVGINLLKILVIERAFLWLQRLPPTVSSYIIIQIIIIILKMGLQLGLTVRYWLLQYLTACTGDGSRLWWHRI